MYHKGTIAVNLVERGSADTARGRSADKVDRGLLTGKILLVLQQLEREDVDTTLSFDVKDAGAPGEELDRTDRNMAQRPWNPWAACTPSIGTV